MHVVSVQVGQPRRIQWKGRSIETAIFKEPVEGRVAVGETDLAGDRQADLRVHGGRDKAVYAYPSEHYAFWGQELEGVALPFGAFGENLTLAGLTEREARIGDRVRIGTAELVVTEPRVPCFKLAAKFGRADLILRFLASRRSGFYLRVARTGELGREDALELLERGGDLRVADVVELFVTRGSNRSLFERALADPALSTGWKEWLAERRSKADQR